MKQLKEQIKNKTFSNIYLFSGEEKYLIEIYQKRIVDSIFKGQDQMMNCDQFDQNNKDVDKIELSLETLPFFADKRVVLLKNLDLFNAKNKQSNERITDSLKKVSDTTVCIIIEDKIDKRNKLYKFIKSKGGFYEFGFQSEKELIQYVARELNRVNMKISTVDAKYFIDTVGYELRSIINEISKLIDYVGENTIVTKTDINDVCTKHLESKIFELVDAVGLKERERALLLYQDMLALKEPALKILFMISRQFTLIFQGKLLYKKRISNNHIAKELKIPEFVVRKVLSQGNQFSLDAIKEMIKELVDLEYSFKNGRINLETGIELMILKLSK